MRTLKMLATGFAFGAIITSLLLGFNPVQQTSKPTCVAGTYMIPSPDGGFFTIDDIELCGADMELRDLPTLPSLQ